MAKSIILDPKKAGFYQLKDKITFSKLEAIEHFNRTNEFPEWEFNRAAFDAVDWLTEPADTLSEIYSARCRQIREAYDYVILMYSGGSDSHNILQHWLSTGCKLDEIASYWNYEGSKDDLDLQNAEIKLVVFPMIQRLRDLGHDFRFRLIDHSVADLENIKSVSSIEYNINCNFSPNHLGKFTFRDSVPEWRRLISAGKKVCLLWGVDKPQVYLDDKGHYLQFFDFIDHCASPYVQNRFHLGWYDELFYWTPDMPEIVQKQARIVKRFLDTSEDQSCFQKEKSRNGYSTKLSLYLTDSALRKLIYPFWNDDIFSNGKNVRSFFSTRSQWLWDSNLEEANRFVEIGKSAFARAGTYWVNDHTDIFKGWKCHASPRYYL